MRPSISHTYTLTPPAHTPRLVYTRGRCTPYGLVFLASLESPQEEKDTPPDEQPLVVFGPLACAPTCCVAGGRDTPTSVRQQQHEAESGRPITRGEVAGGARL
jgi:hypothetical protein